MDWIIRATALAAAILGAGTSLAATDRDHLQCFKIKDAADKAAYTADLSPGNPAFPSIAPGCTIKVPAKLLCIDVAKTNVSPTPAGSPDGEPGREYLCYKAVCDKQQIAIDAKDQFDNHALTVSSTSLVCAPIDVRAGSSDQTYVVSAIDLPMDGAEAQALGFDLDGLPGDGVDNELGSFLGSLQALIPGYDIQGLVDRSVDRGEAVLLASVRSTDLTDADPARFSVYAGSTDISPPACSDASDTVCRRHLNGTGAFDVDVSSPTDARLVGSIRSGTFHGGPGTVTLQVRILGTALVLPLEMAEVELTGLSDSGWVATGSKIGGAIKQTDLESTVVPAFAGIARAIFAADCTVGGTPPSCACGSGTDGAILRDLYDDAPTQDCTISDAEVSAVLSGILVPDIDLDADGTNDALSIGIGIKAVKGTFTPP